jgi:tRNA nucleotidyltransferase (CCA-adding enzyme)
MANLREKIIEKLSPDILKLLGNISEIAADYDTDLFLVGGVVRDLLLGFPVDQDIDLVTTGNALVLADSITGILGGKVVRYKKFKTATIDFGGGHKIDLVTARKEYYPYSGSLPQIEPSNLKEDLGRRDFSINALACSLDQENYGHVIDYYKGQQDLTKKRIRVLHRNSFTDDPLRIIRAVRFEQRYSFKMESETYELLTAAVQNRLINNVSLKRLKKELHLINNEPDPAGVKERLVALGVFSLDQLT